MPAKIEQIGSDRLKESVLLTLSMGKWGNRRILDKDSLSLKRATDETETISTDTKKDLSVSKKLIRSKEYQDILAFQAKLYIDITSPINGVLPSFREAFYFCPSEMVESVNSRIEEAQYGLSELVERFARVYPAQCEESRVRLEADGLYRASDFPPVEVVKSKFWIKHFFLQFEVGENLPQEMRKAELEKLSQAFAESRDIVSSALTDGFLQVLRGITSKLSQKTGTEKLIFRDSLFEDLVSFMGTFSTRNLGNDEKLAKLVSQASGILSQVNGDSKGKAQAIRDNEELREQTKAAFAALKVQVETSLEEKPTRRFNFDIE